MIKSKRPDRFTLTGTRPQNLDRLAPMSAHGLRWKFVTLKPVRSGDGRWLDFIINYDVKYRMGASAGEGGDE